MSISLYNEVTYWSKMVKPLLGNSLLSIKPYPIIKDEYAEIVTFSHSGSIVPISIRIDILPRFLTTVDLFYKDKILPVYTFVPCSDIEHTLTYESWYKACEFNSWLENGGEGKLTIIPLSYDDLTESVIGKIEKRYTNLSNCIVSFRPLDRPCLDIEDLNKIEFIT